MARGFVTKKGRPAQPNPRLTFFGQQQRQRGVLCVAGALAWAGKGIPFSGGSNTGTHLMQSQPPLILIKFPATSYPQPAFQYSQPKSRRTVCEC